MVVPFAAGSGTDQLARALAQDLSDNLGQQFVVENRAGAGGNIGAGSVAKAAPDGYTILFGTPGPLANNKLMYKDLPFDPEQAFTPIVLIAKSAGHHRGESVAPGERCRGTRSVLPRQTPASSMSASPATVRLATSPRCWCRRELGGQHDKRAVSRHGAR